MIDFQKLSEFIKFCMVGASGVLVNMGGYFLLTRSLGIPIEVASPIAIEASIIWNFFWNNMWTFGNRVTKDSWQKKLLRFHVVCALAGVINYLLLLLMVRAFGWWDMQANLLGIAAGVLVKYFMHSFWTWREMPVNPKKWPGAVSGKL
jgi:dolichol-phosphate mannosyltransferase